MRSSEFVLIDLMRSTGHWLKPMNSFLRLEVSLLQLLVDLLMLMLVVELKQLHSYYEFQLVQCLAEIPMIGEQTRLKKLESN